MSVAPATLPLSPSVPAPGASGDGRLPGFERVRAGAMLLVVAFHAALPYACGALPGLIWVTPVTGENPGTLADPLFWAAEAVIMPLFFAMSGFFSARLGETREAGAFVAGRTRRVLLPFLVACGTVLLLSLTVWMLALPLTGRATWREFVRFNPPRELREQLWGTAHLWYLEYLFLWALLQSPLDAVARAADRGENPLAARLLGRLDGWTRSPLRWCVPAAGLAVVLGVAPEVYLGFQHGWFPHPAKFLHSGVCFLFGWLCWRNRDALAGSTRQTVPLALAALASVAPVVWAVRSVIGGDLSDRLLAAPVSLCAALAMTAALVHGAGSRRPAGRVVAALAGASFWVYLLHQPLVGALQLGLWFVEWPADAEFAVVFVAAAGFCLASEPLSRRTAVGRALTGRTGRKPVRRAVPVDLPVRRAA